jgi:TolA-binding protein
MKKFYAFAVVVAVLWWYATTRFNFEDAFKYAHAHPAASWAPGVEYSIGLVYYQRADFPKSQQAFTQLLTDFPTGQYEARGLLRLSEAAEENRDWQTSKDALSKYLEDFPDGPDRPIVEKRKELLYNK